MAELNALSIGFVLLWDLGGLRRSNMDQNSITKYQRFAFPKRMTSIPAGIIVKIVQAEGIRGKQGVAPNVPIGRIAETAGVIKNRYT